MIATQANEAEVGQVGQPAVVDDGQGAVTQVQALQVLGELHLLHVPQQVVAEVQHAQMLQARQCPGLHLPQGVVGQVEGHQAEGELGEEGAGELGQAVVAQVQVQQLVHGGEHLALDAGSVRQRVNLCACEGRQAGGGAVHVCVCVYVWGGGGGAYICMGGRLP